MTDFGHRGTGTPDDPLIFGFGVNWHVGSESVSHATCPICFGIVDARFRDQHLTLWHDAALGRVGYPTTPEPTAGGTDEH